MPSLNAPQRAAVRYIDGPLLVLAGAGSGKTRVITHKIAFLIKDCGIEPRHIAAVTFTNKAAREMKARVTGLLKGQEARGLTVSTFHTLGLNILRREHARLGYKSGFTIFDSSDCLNLLRELLRKERGTDNKEVEPLLAAIGRFKNQSLSPEAALSTAPDELTARAARLYAHYTRNLRAYNAFDFDDLIGQPVQLFHEHPELLNEWQDRLRFLLVDEYQDTNASQYALVRQLVGVRGALTAVGDDDQSVYSWRGARPENLAQLGEDFPRLKVIKLEQNYRSAGRILKAANALIANNPHVFEKSLWSDLGFGDPLRVLSCRDAEHEAERVVSELLHHQFTSRGDYGDYALLYRGNHQARAFERVLREHQIPYTISGGTSFFEYAEVKDVMAYLRLLINGDDDAAFLRVVNTPRREIGASTLERLGAFASERNLSLFAACFEDDLCQALSTRAHNNLTEFTRWLVELGDRGMRGDPMAAVRDMLRDIRYEDWLTDQADEPKAAERRIENVRDLLAWMQRLTEQEGDKTLADLVRHMALMDLLDRNEDEKRTGVQLMTLHAAKGLEFDHVFIVGMEEELLPHRSSIAEDSLEEERRLAYVGITRARKSLNFTLTRQRKRYGEIIDCEPSRFLAELPADDVVWEGREDDINPEQRQTRGQAHLANLRGLLK